MPINPIRDLWLGRLGLPTVEDPVAEQLGSPVTATGDSTVVGLRRVKGFTTNFPVHGTTGDANPFYNSNRMRRQLRSMMQNHLYRLSGLYVMMTFDPERNGWLVIGTAMLNDTDGGPTLGEYQLQITDGYRTAGLASHRDGFRVDLTDLRLSYTPIDYYGQYAGSSFSGLTALALPAVPVGGSDIAVLEAPTVTITRPSSDGPVPLVTAKKPYFQGASAGPLVTGDVYSWERPEPYFNRGDVVAWDRRGTITENAPEVAYENLVANPSFQYDTNGQAPALWQASTPGWWLNAGATLTVVNTKPWSGTQSLQIVTTAAAASQGTVIPVTTPAGFLAGVTYTATVHLQGNAGGESINIGLGAASADSTTATYALTTSWAAYSVTWTPTAYETTAYVAVRTSSAAAVTVFLDGISGVLGSTAPSMFFDGDTPGAGWLGVTGRSASILPPTVNAVPNGNFQYDPLNGAPASWALTGWLVGQVQQGLSPSAPPAYQSLRLTTAALNSGTSATARVATGLTLGGVANCLHIAPGQSLVVQAIANVLARAGTMTLQSQVTWYTAAGAVISTSNGANQGSAGVPAQMADVFTAPANAVAAGVTLAATSGANGSSIDLAVNKVMVSHGASIPAYGDGDALGWRWTGTYGNSISAADITDGQLLYGWEEVYGIDWPYSWLAPGGVKDVPVLSNGICRVRYDPTPGPGFCVDVWTGSAYVEQGQFIVGIDDGALDTTLIGASLQEWTPERGVVEAVLTNGSAASRERVLLTLQRGWLGPRIEVYSPDNDAAIIWCTPSGDLSDSLLKIDGASAPAVISSAGIGGAANQGLLLGASGFPGENEVALVRQGSAYQMNFAVVSPLDVEAVYGAGEGVAGTWGYPVATNGVQFAATASPELVGYASLHTSFAAQVTDQVNEAEVIRNSASGTTSAQSDAAALANPAAAPTTGTATTGGTLPAGTIGYKYTAYDAQGETLGSATATQVTTGTTSTVTLTLGAVAGAVGYAVYRVSGPATIGLVALTGTTSLTDTGTTAKSGLAPPTTNTTGETSSGGQFVRDTQAAATNTTLTKAATTLIAGLYRTFLRVRVDPGTTGSFKAVVAGTNSPSAVTSTANVWTWIDLGETSGVAAGALSVTAWRSAGSGNVYVDLVELFLLDDSTAASPQYAGARNLGQLALYDQRVENRKVSRA